MFQEKNLSKMNISSFFDLLLSSCHYIVVVVFFCQEKSFGYGTVHVFRAIIRPTVIFFQVRTDLKSHLIFLLFTVQNKCHLRKICTLSLGLSSYY